MILSIMEQFEIRCTPQQTQKALQLGAPIIKVDTFDKRLIYGSNMCYPLTEADYPYAIYPYAIPTAEEMIGWLEEQNNIIITIEIGTDCWHSRVSNPEIYIKRINKPTRKKATLAAIDAALDYLSNKK